MAAQLYNNTELLWRGKVNYYTLKPQTRLLVTVLPEPAAESERETWGNLAALGLAAAYGPDEPAYSLDLLKERNPK